MKRPIRIAALVVAAGLLLAVAPAVVRATEPAGTRWVCPPCATPCDTLVFRAPGVCPVCGMALVAQAAAARLAAEQPPVRRVAIVVFDGAEILDFTGPYEMFGAAGCDVYLVAESKNPVTTAMGMTVVPRYTFADAPQPDVLLIPGGAVRAAQGNEAVLRYIRETTAHTRNTMSVCNGAFILASAGLLDGLEATTTNGNITRMQATFPRVRVVRDRRVVDNGRLITTAGLSAGMDGALHVIARLFGNGVAQQVALGEEYDWRDGKGYVRARMADNQIPDVPLDSLGRWTVQRTEGDTRHWVLELQGRSDLARAELERRLERALVDHRWIREKQMATTDTSSTSTWRFAGTDGRRWKGTLGVEHLRRVAGDGPDYAVELSIARAR